MLIQDWGHINWIDNRLENNIILLEQRKEGEEKMISGFGFMIIGICLWEFIKYENREIKQIEKAIEFRKSIREKQG
jgi:hypothetical protein